mgnify:CR=1 FL=1
MKYDYKTREKLVDGYKASWDKKLNLLPGDIKAFAEDLDNYYQSQQNNKGYVEEAIREFKSGGYDNPSQYMKNNHKKLVDLYVPKEFHEDFYYIIDKFNQFPYSKGMERRTVRTKKYGSCANDIFRLLYDYKVFDFYGCNMEDFLLNNLADEKLDYKNNPLYNFNARHIDDMIAARIDNKDEKAIDSIRNIMLSDNNTAVVTVDIIRGIVKSSDENLHKLLGDFLLAARLQEGVRQAICENADCGTVEGFLMIFDVIVENNLERFAAVKRAIATWTGLCDVENMDRITNKILKNMKFALRDRQKAYEFTRGNDSIEIIIGLWAIGFYDVEEAISIMEGYLESGTRNQLLTMSYYNRALWYKDFSDRSAIRVVERYRDDYEMLAAFIPTYLIGVENYAREVVNRQDNINKDNKTYLKVPVTYLYKDEDEAYRHFEIIKNIYENMKKKKMEFSPCIFPWYSICITRTQLIVRMCLIAYSLEDNSLIDYVVQQIPNIEVNGNYYSSRSLYVEMLLNSPKTDIQRDMLVRFVADKESMTRTKAYEIVKNMSLEDRHYIKLEEYLKYKTSDIRQNVINLLSKQEDEKIISCATRLVQSGKEEMRMGGLTLISEVKMKEKKKENNKSFVDLLINVASKIETPTEKEQILIDEIIGNGCADKILNTEGYGLYNPHKFFNIPDDMKANKNKIIEYFNVPKKIIDEILNKLVKYIDDNSHLEYKKAYGSECLLGNSLSMTNYDDTLPLEDRYPFKELWKEFFEKEISDIKILNNVRLAICNNDDKIENLNTYLKYERLIFGNSIPDYEIPNKKYSGQYRYDNDINTILLIMLSIYDNNELRAVAKEIILYIIEKFPEDALWYKKVKDDRYYYTSEPEEIAFVSSWRMSVIINTIRKSDNEKEFRDKFFLFYLLDNKFRINDKNKPNVSYYSRPNNRGYLDIFDYIKAYTMKLIPIDIVYKAAFEDIGLSASLEHLSMLYQDKLTSYERNVLKGFIVNDELDKESQFYIAGVKIYNNIVNKVLDVELKRGDLPTVFTNSIGRIKRIYGMDRFVQILKALGKDKLDRKTYYGSCGTGKVECLSHLLQVCYPGDDDDADKLAGMIKSSGIKEQRLIETAMYAPQWIDIIEKYLGYEGLKSGCYYFMAHMNEQFDDRKKAVIAKFTPLSQDELNNGAFDVNWFEDAYKLLGEELFNKLYDGAKYISDGSKHSRARKYADAALGKIDIKDLEKQINDKRNKDLLMSYGIVPIVDKKDALNRYEYLQNFLKQSRQFGAQRRASEALAVDMALKNLATKSGFSDVTRLTLAMETEIVKAYSKFFDEYEVEGVTIKLSISETGQTGIVLIKKEKELKSIPGPLKKNEYVVKIMEVNKKLKEQYRRTVKMFEQAMEDRETYSFEELKNLCENPVVVAVVKALVFVTDGTTEDKIFGFISNNGLTDYKGKEKTIPLETMLRVAHPYDMYKEGCWTEYQKCLYSGVSEGRGIKQPFKQVFRELYVKLEEEKDKHSSKMFAGNQIQPNKTVSCLKGRRWIADYEDGLQKVYYNEDIIARIYALADWFSPSEVEAPTLEWVEFSDRKTFKTIAIENVPDIIYSEVMRDVDLAVSVAHAGGVDPETSHSTVQMRKVIIEFNLPLFRIDNVSFEGNHAIVKGINGTYSIHLGSGVIHKIGSHQINVLPVHSQNRGKLFLPFIDDDPKTAEIMSKIVLFSKDDKIKDPYILEQLVK